jgi:hypothetical protein
MPAISIDKALLKKASNRGAEYKTPLFTAYDGFFRVQQRSEVRESNGEWTSENIMAQLERTHPDLKKVMEEFDNGQLEIFEFPKFETEAEYLRFIAES